MNQDILREQFPQLGEDQSYLDWTGAALAPVSLINAHSEYLRNNLLGNPHSHHSPSAKAMGEVLETRRSILKFFHAPEDEYEVIFTSGATAAIRLLENFKFEGGGELLLTADNHNSVNGLREMAKRAGAVHRYVPLLQDLRIDGEAFIRMLQYPRSTGNRLLAFPAKSNYSGTLHDQDWVNIAQGRGWYVLLDAAAYLSGGKLDLRKIRPDFVPISFYKMFGYPTGVGCLLIRKRAYQAMHKRSFAGGSILLVSVAKDFFAQEPLGYARYEDGTVNFSGIPAIRSGLEFLTQLGDRNSHAIQLAMELYDQLYGREEGQARVRIHSPRGTDMVTFSIHKGQRAVESWMFENAASSAGVYVRTGCFCNPGVNEKIFNYNVDSFERLYNDAISTELVSLEELQKYAGGNGIGAIRASFGYANTEKDVTRIVEVVNSFLGDV